jgi:hypothetical protein
MKTFEKLTAGHDLIFPGQPIDWLMQFKNSVDQEEPEVVAERLLNLSLDNKSPDYTKELAEELCWLNELWKEYNRAVWEVIAAKPRLMEMLRGVIESILAPIKNCPSPFDSHPPDFSRSEKYFRRINCENLLAHFLKSEPDPAWVGEPE